MKSSLFSSARRRISSIAFWISSPIWLKASARTPTSLPLRTRHPGRVVAAGQAPRALGQHLHRPADLAREQGAQHDGERRDDRHHAQRLPLQVDRREVGLVDVALDDHAPVGVVGHAHVGAEHVPGVPVGLQLEAGSSRQRAAASPGCGTPARVFGGLEEDAHDLDPEKSGGQRAVAGRSARPAGRGCRPRTPRTRRRRRVAVVIARIGCRLATASTTPATRAGDEHGLAEHDHRLLQRGRHDRHRDHRRAVLAALEGLLQLLFQPRVLQREARLRRRGPSGRPR